MRFIPLALNHLGLKGPHFQAALSEFATILIAKPEGYSLLRGPFALTHYGALHKIMRSLGTRLTWIAQREHASQVFRRIHSLYDAATFLMQWHEEGRDRLGMGD